MTGHAPVPGLQGDFTGTCIACLQPTDTALGVEGTMDWHAPFLHGALGVPVQEAIATVEKFHPEPDERGRYAVTYRVCVDCAGRLPSTPRPVLAIPDELTPFVTQP